MYEYTVGDPEMSWNYSPSVPSIEKTPGEYWAVPTVLNMLQARDRWEKASKALEPTREQLDARLGVRDTYFPAEWSWIIREYVDYLRNPGFENLKPSGALRGKRHEVIYLDEAADFFAIPQPYTPPEPKPGWVAARWRSKANPAWASFKIRLDLL